MAMKDIPPGALAEFDQAYRHNAHCLDKIIEEHRGRCTNEYERIVSLLAQIDAARMDPDAACHLLTVAVDRLARAER